MIKNVYFEMMSQLILATFIHINKYIDGHRVHYFLTAAFVPYVKNHLLSCLGIKMIESYSDFISKRIT